MILIFEYKVPIHEPQNGEHSILVGQHSHTVPHFISAKMNFETRSGADGSEPALLFTQPHSHGTKSCPSHDRTWRPDLTRENHVNVLLAIYRTVTAHWQLLTVRGNSSADREKSTNMIFSSQVTCTRKLCSRLAASVGEIVVNSGYRIAVWPLGFSREFSYCQTFLEAEISEITQIYWSRRSRHHSVNMMYRSLSSLESILED